MFHCRVWLPAGRWNISDWKLLAFLSIRIAILECTLYWLKLKEGCACVHKSLVICINHPFLWPRMLTQTYQCEIDQLDLLIIPNILKHGKLFWFILSLLLLLLYYHYHYYYYIIINFILWCSFLLPMLGPAFLSLFFGPRDPIPFPWHRFHRFRDPGGLGHTTCLLFVFFGFFWPHGIIVLLESHPLKSVLI